MVRSSWVLEPPEHYKDSVLLDSRASLATGAQYTSSSRTCSGSIWLSPPMSSFVIQCIVVLLFIMNEGHKIVL